MVWLNNSHHFALGRTDVRRYVLALCVHQEAMFEVQSKR
ncbi:hypothetical protein Spiaf_1408 [Spirochaeta africana DSM 8902]|uniref:Uncharacterized protein n=1 Tax=Spirochaeta africana (strain ATCC 700263 / DSM 8902 / Z-7692) TaxID=889378 RepID=H9UIX8_SPIAZ|nr:hypothetical protein Spiaf_1408 [Spirochaeta africana DSM 8902]